MTRVIIPGFLAFFGHCYPQFLRTAGIDKQGCVNFCCYGLMALLLMACNGNKPAQPAPVKNQAIPALTPDSGVIKWAEKPAQAIYVVDSRKNCH